MNLQQIADLTDHPFTIYRAISGKKSGRYYNSAHWVFRINSSNVYLVVRAWTPEELMEKVLLKLTAL